MFKFGSAFNITASTITIEIPVGKPVMGTCVTRDTSEWEIFFAECANKSKDLDLKKEYERCRTAIKWAETCNGKVYAVNNNYKRVPPYQVSIVIVFSFESFDDLTHFVSHLSTILY